MHRRTIRSIAAATLVMLLVTPIAAAHPDQHGTPDGHLTGSGSWGDFDLVSKATVTNVNDLVADVGVDPRGEYAYLANWGRADCDANSEAGGTNNPDAGVYVVDIRDLENPQQVGFIAHSQDSRPGEGVQVVDVTTKFFTGTMLVTNNEQCGKNGKGGVSLFDVSDPTTPKKLSEHFGDRGSADTNDIHSAFAWDAGDNAYVVVVDNFESSDVDILDITNPKRPRLIAEYNLNALSRAQGNPIDQPTLGLQESSLHDMTVKLIDGRWIMLLSYWDGGYVKFDVTNPAAAQILGDTDYAAVDPELLAATGTSLPPEGNGHQAEFTPDNRFFIATDEDFSPYRSIFTIDTGPNAGEYQAGEFGFTPPVQTTLSDGKLNGPTVFGGYGCPGDRDSIPAATTVFPSVGADEERIIVFERGPVNDPDASGDACFFSEKIESGQLAGYDAVVIANHHSGAQGGSAPDAHFCGGQGHEYEKTAPAVCIGHRAMHLLFDSPLSYAYPEASPAVGDVGQSVSFTPVFDGWGYVHLFDANTLAGLDTYAVPEAHQESKAFGFGDLSVHEVATHPTNSTGAYLAYYSAGMRSIEIDCTNPADTSTCDLVETGGYLDPNGNDFWGVETFVRDGQTYVLGSDRDSGLWIFRDTHTHP
ncbi:MAG: hypothetical protein M3N53_01980 [Actinomycetota bacterium]|nr:hypothetical protein [Actinomycetota bacterium]